MVEADRILGEDLQRACVEEGRLDYIVLYCTHSRVEESRALTGVGVVPRVVAGGAAAVDLAELASIARFVDGAAEGALGHWGACGS